MEIRLDRVTKTFPSGVAAVRDVSLTIPADEWLVVVGPSGCGKTTLLRLIAGLESPTGGAITLGGVDVASLPAGERQLAMLFQRPALLPGGSVRDNLAWPWTLRQAEPWRTLKRLAGRNLLTGAQRGELADVARLLSLDGLLDRPTAQLSGGQQQRVALGRALLRRAAGVLLDEPLAHLDPPLRTHLRRDIRLLYARHPATIVYVTHDPAEALSLGERIAVLHNGTLRQVDRPSIIRESPADRFVAEWFAAEDGGLNTIDVRLEAEELRGPLGSWPLPSGWHQLPPEVTLGIRGRDVRVSDGRLADEMIHLPATAVLEEPGRDGTWVVGETVIGRWAGRRDGATSVIGKTVTMAFSLDRACVFDRATGRTLYAPTG